MTRKLLIPWVRGILLPVVALLWVIAAARATSPQLSATTPLGAQRGTEVEIALHGERLADAREILWYSPGIEVLKLEVPTNQAAVVKVRLKIAADCRLGEHALRIRCASGISDLRTFWVGPYPTVKDTAPNSEFAQAQVIPANVTVEGVVENEAVHYYRFEAHKGQRLSAEVEGMRLGRSQFDPFVAILNAGRFVLASSDDTALLLQDPACSVIAPADGNYYVQIRESSYGGNGNCHFRLHVGGFPRPTGVYPAGGKAGETLGVQFLGDGVGELTRQIKLPEGPREQWAVYAEQDGQTSPSPNWLRVSLFSNVLETEPNDDWEHATAAGTNYPVACNGIISRNGDVDWFRYTATKGQVIEINVYARRLRSPLDSVLSVHDAKGKELASNDDSAGPDSYLRFTAPEAGEFLLRISDHLKKGGADYVYRVELTPVAEALTLKVPDVSRNNAQERKSIVVPRGNRFALLVQAERKNFGGELQMQATSLPPGLSFACDQLAASQNQLPVVFEATTNAPIGGKLSQLSAQPTNTTQKVTGGLRQDYVFVRGEPGDAIYSQTFVEDIAAAVVEEVPFRIKVIEPRVPLVRSGAMDLRVQVERQPGFDDPITLRMLYNPPGVGSASEVVVPKGETNALYRLNANGDAELRIWKIALLAEAKVGGSSVWVSSQLTSLTVAEPFLTVKIEMASAEPGQSAKVFCALDQKIPFAGPASCTLLGLPNAATTKEASFTKDDKQLVFEVNTTTNTPLGQHRTLFCSVTITKDGEPIQHSLGGGGILRIDPPKPAPKVTAPPVAATAPTPAKVTTPTPPVEKPLTRLEKLRLEHAEKLKQAREGQAK